MDLYSSPNLLAPYYQHFRVSERCLLTGHSHQAWPDVAREGLLEAFEDAARHVDDKWARALDKAQRVCRGYATRLEDPDGSYVLASSTHDLLVRLLSALPLRNKPRIVTTDGEYHSARRQFDRLSEEGIEIAREAVEPVETLAERLAARVDDRTALVMVSRVMFRSSLIVPHLGALAQACRGTGTPLLIDVYHALNVVPSSLHEEALQDAYVVGGGYKYMQLGEGNAFLRIPPESTLRPVITGWFAEMDAISAASRTGQVTYGKGGLRFAGATYDPSSHYRAARVLDFLDEMALSPSLLREISQHQRGILVRAFDALDLDPKRIDRDRSRPLSAFGGFLALRTREAGTVCEALRRRGVLTDHRDGVLRLGPAPYLSESQLLEAVGLLGEVLRAGGN